MGRRDAACSSGLTAVALERQITWYLAVDQFGYLTFAHDLLHGQVFHDWAPLEALEPFFPPRTDVLVQTYVYDHGRLYCRYAPGFPLLLAGWIGVFGDDRAHYLNPTLYLVLLAVAVAFQWRIFRSPWRAMAGTALIALFPTMMHLWGLTLTRDLSAHVFGFIGLFLLLPVRGRPDQPEATPRCRPGARLQRGDSPRRRPLPRAGGVYAGAALVAAADAARSGDGASSSAPWRWASSSVRRPFWPTTGLPPAIR